MGGNVQLVSKEEEEKALKTQLIGKLKKSDADPKEVAKFIHENFGLEKIGELYNTDHKFKSAWDHYYKDQKKGKERVHKLFMEEKTLKSYGMLFVESMKALFKLETWEGIGSAIKKWYDENEWYILGPSAFWETVNFIIPLRSAWYITRSEPEEFREAVGNPTPQNIANAITAFEARFLDVVSALPLLRISPHVRAAESAMFRFIGSGASKTIGAVRNVARKAEKTARETARTTKIIAKGERAGIESLITNRINKIINKVENELNNLVEKGIIKNEEKVTFMEYIEKNVAKKLKEQTLEKLNEHSQIILTYKLLKSSEKSLEKMIMKDLAELNNIPQNVRNAIIDEYTKTFILNKKSTLYTKVEKVRNMGTEIKEKARGRINKRINEMVSELNTYYEKEKKLTNEINELNNKMMKSGLTNDDIKKLRNAKRDLKTIDTKINDLKKAIDKSENIGKLKEIIEMVKVVPTDAAAKGVKEVLEKSYGAKNVREFIELWKERKNLVEEIRKVFNEKEELLQKGGDIEELEKVTQKHIELVKKHIDTQNRISELLTKMVPDVVADLRAIGKYPLETFSRIMERSKLLEVFQLIEPSAPPVLFYSIGRALGYSLVGLSEMVPEKVPSDISEKVPSDIYEYWELQEGSINFEDAAVLNMVFGPPNSETRKFIDDHPQLKEWMKMNIGNHGIMLRPEKAESFIENFLMRRSPPPTEEELESWEMLEKLEKEDYLGEIIYHIFYTTADKKDIDELNKAGLTPIGIRRALLLWEKEERRKKK